MKMQASLVQLNDSIQTANANAAMEAAAQQEKEGAHAGNLSKMKELRTRRSRKCVTDSPNSLRQADRGKDVQVSANAKRFSCEPSVARASRQSGGCCAKLSGSLLGRPAQRRSCSTKPRKVRVRGVSLPLIS